ncbi:transcription repressor MYB5-like [Solanum dulcamara]|uniref:transcription repressor MYB5-like n=1 Tax=Solanum dulcamara TaxID=45834 RepID=UPI002485211D|nr:transcription repressor MYB5-like [Solanum dulcamara]
MEDWDRSSTSDNASLISADSTRVVALETTNEETFKLEFSEDEEMLIAKMFNLVGERWSLIAGRIPGRSANEIEKYWKSRYSKSQGGNLLQPKDEAQSIGLIEECGHSKEEINGQPQQYLFPEKRPISVFQSSETGPLTTIGPNNISKDQKLVNPAQDQTNQ